MSDSRPLVGITLGDPRGIGPEVVAGALRRPEIAGAATFRLIGPEDLPELAGEDLPPGAELESIGRWETEGDERLAGELAARAIERGIELALAAEIDGLCTAPISKAALHAAGWDFPGHTELLRERTGVPEVTMMMAAEETPLGGPLRMALLTGHVALREVTRRLTIESVACRTAIAARALRDWWGMDRPRLAFAGVNPHASEGGLFGDEEDSILLPGARRAAEEVPFEMTGVFPGDTVFRRCLRGDADAVVVPYHDVGLAVIKTLAQETGVNVTAGLPFPRTSPDHGTAFDIAGRGLADPGSMAAALSLCARFARAARTA